MCIQIAAKKKSCYLYAYSPFVEPLNILLNFPEKERLMDRDYKYSHIITRITCFRYHLLSEHDFSFTATYYCSRIHHIPKIHLSRTWKRSIFLVYSAKYQPLPHQSSDLQNIVMRPVNGIQMKIDKILT